MISARSRYGRGECPRYRCWRADPGSRPGPRRWRPEPSSRAAATAAADEALDGLRDRGSPSHDGLAARLRGFEVDDGRLGSSCSRRGGRCGCSPDNAAAEPVSLCIVRAADGRWLAGRRAAWLASWAGRWALGAGGSVEVDENPADTMPASSRRSGRSRPSGCRSRRWSGCRAGSCLLVGQAWLPEGAEVTPDAEHDDFAWWPADRRQLAAEADAPLRGWPRCCATREAMSATADRVVTFRRLEAVSFVHSAVYLSLLVCAFVLGNPQPETFILGLAHGVIWIGMSLVCIAAARGADHPLLAGGDRRRARRPGAVRRLRSDSSSPSAASASGGSRKPSTRARVRVDQQMAVDTARSRS